MEGGREGGTYLVLRKLHRKNERKLIPFESDGLVVQSLSALHRHVHPGGREGGRVGGRERGREGGVVSDNERFYS